jgi:hypothetical protein
MAQVEGGTMTEYVSRHVSVHGYKPAASEWPFADPWVALQRVARQINPGTDAKKANVKISVPDYPHWQYAFFPAVSARKKILIDRGRSAELEQIVGASYDQHSHAMDWSGLD